MLEEDGPGLAHGHPPALRLFGHDLLEHALEVHLHLLHVGCAQDRDRGHAAPGDRDLDLAVFELAGQQPVLHLLARPLAPLGGLVSLVRVGLAPVRGLGRGQEQVEQPLLDPQPRLFLDGFALGGSHQQDRCLDQVADQALDVAAIVADLGVLGGLGLHKRCADEYGQPAGDLCLAHPGRADQHDVLGRDLGAEIVRQLPPSPAIAQGNRHGPLGVGLADDVAVQLGDDLPGGQLGLVLRHGNSSTVKWLFV